MRGILLDSETGDLKVLDGKGVVGDITDQNQRLLLLVEKGEMKHALLRGVGVREYLDDENPQALEREIRRQFALDGLKIKRFSGPLNKLTIDATYG